MALLDPTPSPWTGRARSIVRIVVGFAFLVHGTAKLFGVPPGGGPVDSWFSLMGLAGILETFGGLLIVLGLFTRPVAFVLAGEMAVAYFMAHFPKSFWPAQNGGEPALLFCFFFLYLVFAGPGEWSVDAGLARSRGDAAATPRAAAR